MIKRILISTVVLLVQINIVFCSEVSSLQPIETIFNLPEEKIDLALAKLTIDKTIDTKIDITHYMTKIAAMVSEINKLLPQNPTSKDKLAALKKYLYESGSWNNYQAYVYDFADPTGEDLNNQLLSTYLETKKGNCVSMPCLFLILGKKLDLNVAAATAPLHNLVRYVDPDTGITINIEATDEGYVNSDAFYIKWSHISEDAIKNQVYLTSLTNKETLSVMVMILNPYYVQKGEYQKALEVCDLALKYSPKDV